MKKSLYILFSFCTIVFLSCKKKELPAENTDAAESVFYVQATVNGFPIKLEAGANDFLAKPFDIDVLLKKIEKNLKG